MQPMVKTIISMAQIKNFNLVILERQYKTSFPLYNFP